MQAQQQQQQRQQQQQQQQGPGLGSDPGQPPWLLRLQLLALRCLGSLVHNREHLSRLLSSPRGASSGGSPEEQSAAAMADCLLALVSPDAWQRGCGGGDAGGAALAATLGFLARRGPLFLLLSQIAAALPPRGGAYGGAPLGEALVTQAAVRCVALQQQQQQQGQGQARLGLLALACTPGLWQRCPSLAPAGPQVMLRALGELGRLPGAAAVAERLPSSCAGGKGAAAAALLANLLALGERAVPAAGAEAAAAQVTTALLALLALLPEALLLHQPRGARPEERARFASGGSDDGEADAGGGSGGAAPSPWATREAAAAGGGRLPPPAGGAVDALVARQLGDLGGDAALGLLRRLVAVELPATSAPPGGGAALDAAAAERVWRLCQLAWLLLSCLPQVQQLRALLVLGVSAQLPARVWFNLLRPMQRAAAAAGGGGSGGASDGNAAAGAGIAAVALPDGGGGGGGDSSCGGRAAAWHDPGWQAPLLILSQTLSSFLATADASDLHSALPLAEIFDAAAPQLGLLPLLRQGLWQVRGARAAGVAASHPARRPRAGGPTSSRQRRTSPCNDNALTMPPPHLCAPTRQVIVTEGDQPAPSPPAAVLRRALSAAAGALLARLAERNHRLEFCPAGAFVAEGFSSERFHAEAAAVGLSLGAAGGARQRLAQLLRAAPCLVPFEVRAC
jgi:hypothetical protein